MKKFLLFSALNLAAISAFAQPPLSHSCLRNIEMHISGNHALFDECKLQDKDIYNLLVTLKNKYPQVDYINLESNDIGSKGASEFTFDPELVKNIKTLALKNNHLGNAGAEALGKVTTLERLDVSHNDINDFGAMALAKSESLQMLTMNDNSLTSDGVVALTKIKTLVSLELENIPQDEASLYALGHSRLKYLDISYSNIHSQNLTYVSSLPSLKAISIRGNKLYANEIASFANNKNLVGILADDNLLGDEGAALLTANPNFSFLELSHNKITDTGATALSNIKNLEMLVLDNNSIGDNGATVLSTLPKLDLLELDNNNINDLGAIVLAGNASMTLLSLGSNNIHDEGALSLAENKGKLEYLDVSYNHIGTEAIKTLKNRFDGLNVDGNVSDTAKKSSRKHDEMIKSYCAKVKNIFCNNFN